MSLLSPAPLSPTAPAEAPGRSRRSRWRIGRVLLGLVGALALGYGLRLGLTTPRDDRTWRGDQRVAPQTTIRGDTVTITGVRNFRYTTAETWTGDYETRTYALDSLRRVWYIVEPFDGGFGAAHTFVSFQFGDTTFVGISIEARKEPGETYGIVEGMLNRYELLYVVADERDLIGLRANVRHDSVYVYPVRTTPAGRQALFLSYLDRANRLRAQPEFYHTLWNTCTTNIVRHINTVVPDRIPFSHKVLLPAYADALAFDLGLLDTDRSLADARAHFRVNARAAAAANSPTFSLDIRRGMEFGAAPTVGR